MRKDKSRLVEKIIGCDICGKSIRDDIFSNNAWPITQGRCCDKCNEEHVIPTRLSKFKEVKLK